MIRLIFSLFVVFFIFLFYRFFISAVPFVAHDFPLLFSQSRDFSPFWVISWDYMGGGAIGASAFKTMWIDLYANFVYFVSNSANIPWWLSQRIFWLVPFVLISVFSSYKLSGLFIRSPIYKTSAAIIYTFNSYILLIVGGGQFGIAFSYALSPLVLYGLLKLFEKSNLNTLFISSLLSGLLIAFDPRISFLTFGIAALWYLFLIRDFSFTKLKYIFLNFIIAGFLNSYWVLPGLLSIINSSVSGGVSNYFSVPGVKFLSFATFENSMSFLHPNWPENIFGKIYFQKPEFLLIPILAFGSLLFKVKKELLFFAGIGLAGIFLGKGANEPFGQVYLFLFQNVPGFNLFRDPTKFYILIALSYSLLIPFFLEQLNTKFKKYRHLIIFLFIIYFLFLLKPAWSGELTGIFKPKEIPNEYLKLTQFLKDDKNFSRTLWIPKRQKYGFFEPAHPAADSEVLFAKRQLASISEKEFSDLSIKYLIVPTDPEGEIFLKDRKYDEKQRERTIRRVEQLNLSQLVGFDNLSIYQAKNPKGHFWSPSTSLRVNYRFINPTEYEVSIENAEKGDVLVFSEGFDPNWKIQVLASQGETLQGYSQKFGNLNSFVLPKSGNYELKVSYKVQKWVNVGLVISGLTLLGLISSLIVLYYRHGRAGSRAISGIKT